MLRAWGRVARWSAFVLAVSLSGAALAQTKSFVRDDLASDGIRVEDQLRRAVPATGAKPAPQVRSDAETQLSKNPRAALGMF
jgi:hypothetical protein